MIFIANVFSRLAMIQNVLFLYIYNIYQRKAKKWK
jgi:hypothetical protein